MIRQAAVQAILSVVLILGGFLLGWAAKGLENPKGRTEAVNMPLSQPVERPSPPGFRF